jgi:hypothetical protein
MFRRRATAAEVFSSSGGRMGGGARFARLRRVCLERYFTDETISRTLLASVDRDQRWESCIDTRKFSNRSRTRSVVSRFARSGGFSTRTSQWWRSWPVCPTTSTPSNLTTSSSDESRGSCSRM